MTANDFARAGSLEPLRRTLMGLELRHRNSLDPYWKEFSITCGGGSDRAGEPEGEVCETKPIGGEDGASSMGWRIGIGWGA